MRNPFRYFNSSPKGLLAIQILNEISLGELHAPRLAVPFDSPRPARSASGQQLSQVCLDLSDNALLKDESYALKVRCSSQLAGAEVR
jgi:hypothetical protein